MKMKINRASDLSSISVLPPHSRISKAGPSRWESSAFSKIQPFQLRSQQSQQSFSQGVSSQPGLFSQLSQNSLDETLIDDQRVGYQERESSSRKKSSLPLITYAQEASQMQLSRPSKSLIQKRNSKAPDHGSSLCSEELEHKIGMVETSLSRLGIILDSVQSDLMQTNKGTKEVLLEIEHIRQKLLLTDNSHQQMNKLQEDLKASLDVGLKSISGQLGQNENREKLQEIFSLLSDLPQRFEAFIMNSHNDLCKKLTNEIEKMANSLKVPDQKHPSPSVLRPKKMANSLKVPEQKHPSPSVLLTKATSYHTQPQEMPLCIIPAKARQVTVAPKVEMGRWTKVKHDVNKRLKDEPKQWAVVPIDLEQEFRVILDSDEEIDYGFSGLLEEKETDKYSKEAREETERILRKARRRKRKHSNTIVIN